MILPIYAYGNKVLREPTEDINPEDFEEDLKEILENMYETCLACNGVGLSAPQIGLNYSIFVICTNGKNKAYINPYIIYYSEEVKKSVEGCLSIPGIHCPVERSQEISVEYLDENLEEKSEIIKGFDAVVFQHEYDHLDGQLFIDKISTIDSQRVKDKLKKIKRGGINLNYKMIFKD